MSSDFTKSIVLITSQDLNNGGSGTGFVIHRDAQATYLLTCAHVVSSVGGVDKVSLYGQPAAVIVSGEDQNIDLAVLRVEGLFNRPPLPLCLSGKKGDAFTIAGFLWFDQGFLIRPLQGHLGEEVGLEFRDQAERIVAWDLKIDDPDFDIQKGYSGSPVVHQETGCALGVVSHRQGTTKGLAISVKAVKAIWPGMPGILFANPQEEPPQIPAGRSFLREIKRKNLEKMLADLYKRYEAAYGQLRGMLDEAYKIPLQNQIEQLEQQIQETEQQLNQLS
jgi:hypothetical protein